MVRHFDSRRASPRISAGSSSRAQPAKSGPRSALYDPGAVLTLTTGTTAGGVHAIREAYEHLLVDGSTFTAGDQ